MKVTNIIAHGKDGMMRQARRADHGDTEYQGLRREGRHFREKEQHGQRHGDRQITENFRSPFLNLPCSLACSPPAGVLQPTGPPEQPLGVERAAPGSREWEPHPLVEEENVSSV